ncbi:hypothetical protein CRG98_005471 [Punica granatum]|uniref:Uncharacterized protein n=1 Tax=Punica granatum TaxID=22663 RepID=A0A2I0L0B3_PUNGR|nr:hypothetical protein CRG98_005471 [Punica granatum]
MQAKSRLPLLEANPRALLLISGQEGLPKSDLPSLGIRGKSRGSVRESGDSVERLEGCSGTKDARSGVHEHRARGQACGGVRRRARRAACGCAGERRGAWERAAIGALFTREHDLHPK